MTIASILAHKGSFVHTISDSSPVLAAIQLLHEKRIGALLVTDAEGHVCGVLSERDVVRGIAVHGCHVLDDTTRTIMSAPVVTCRHDASVQQAMEQMTSRRFRHLPVMKGDELVGMVSIGDLVKARIEATEREAAQLKDYITAG